MNDLDSTLIVPTTDSYKEALVSPVYAKQLAYDREWRSNYAACLKRVSRKWVENPLDQWSRKWEYPYVETQLESMLDSGGQHSGATVLDVGSGLSFFPFSIASRHRDWDLYCLDNDPLYLAPASRLLSASGLQNIHFVQSDVVSLPFPTGSLDAIYSVSVMEHLPDWQHALDELCRVLRPGGSMVLTFDVSLDGNRPLTVKLSLALLRSLASSATVDEEKLQIASRLLTEPPACLLTTRSACINRADLPWKWPRFMYALKWRSLSPFRQWPPNICLCCTVARKQ
jgi:ubiquinone/menaquinone biosynthesis C-methylase UbiE